MRVLLVQPSLSPPGGGNLVAAWMLEALRDEHALSLLTWHPPELAACNRFFGTSLRPSDFELLLVPDPLRRIARWTPTPFDLLKHGYLFHRAAAIAHRYEVVITASNEADFGRRGIQYVYYPRLDPARPAVDLRWYHRSRTILAAYRFLTLRSTGFSVERMRANLTLVASDWIGRRVAALHGISSIILHPPVPGEFPAVSWEEREDAFVCIGRISPEKRIETIVAILARVRAAGGEVRLHIVGSDDDRTYAPMIHRLARENAAWVTVHQDIPRSELARLIARQRYGIHAMVDEHFGIAVAEMVRGGCIVFVPANGGPLEIVGPEERLLYESPDEAAAKILATIESRDRQASLRTHLAARADLFSTDRFVHTLRQIVRDFGRGSEPDRDVPLPVHGLKRPPPP